MTKELLTQATNYYRSKKYQKAINILESQIVHNRNDEYFFFILAMCCFNIHEYNTARSYFRRALQLDPHYIDALLGYSLLLLREGNGEEALSALLSILDIKPNHRTAKNLLSHMQSLDGTIDSSFYLLHQRKLAAMMPTVGAPIRIPWRFVGIAMVAVLVLGLASIAALNILGDGTTREGTEEILLAQNESPLSSTNDQSNDTDVVINYREYEIDAILKTIEHDFLNYRDNLVCRNINSILNSNASHQIKIKMNLVLQYLGSPTYVDFSDNFSWQEVAQKPWNYNNCHIKWQGRIANLTSAQDNTATFDLLVDYQEQTNLSGIVSVHVPFEATLHNGMFIELLGTLITSTTIERINVISILPLAPTTQKRDEE